MYGDCGRGKSMLLRYVLPVILLKYANKVVSVFDVQQMNKKPDDVLSKHIIGLDDIGTEDISVLNGNKRSVFSEVMDCAEKYAKLLIIATNLNSEQIEQIYGTRVIERIISTTRRIEFKGKSFRT
jgi:DNA replication protein DnaC